MNLKTLADQYFDNPKERRQALETIPPDVLKQEIGKLSPQAQQFLVALTSEYANSGTSYDFKVAFEMLSSAVEVV